MSKQVMVDLAKGVNFTTDDGIARFYPAGPTPMPEDHANHWYVQAHATKAPPPELGDQAFAVALRKLADHQRAVWQDLEDQAVAAELAWEERTAALAAEQAALTGESEDQTVVDPNAPAGPVKRVARPKPTGN